MGTRSFEVVNFSLRPNKSVERKLISRILNAIGKNSRFDWRDYRYLGLGSMWFVDFIMMHKSIGISKLVSIEKEHSRSKRVAFNAPYSCVEVKIGMSTAVIRELPWDQRTIAWLDYDDQLRSYMFDDLNEIIVKSISGNIVMVSVNAEAAQLNITENGVLLDPMTVLKGLVNATYIPTDAEKRLSKNQFPGLIGEIMFNFMKSSVLSTTRDLDFFPLFNFAYSDGAKMVTYGGVIVDADDEKILKSQSLQSSFEFVAHHGQFEIQVPQLTLKEKLELDKRMPCAAVPKPEELPFELKPSEIEAYRKFYRDYPVYGEFHP
jgi:hypothetical protein